MAKVELPEGCPELHYPAWESYYSTGRFMATVKKSALRAARDALILDLGDVNDLPEDLINTLANVYYGFFLLEEEFASGAAGSVSNADDYRSFMGDSATTIASFEAAAGLIENLRKIRSESPEFFQSFVDLTLDILKYRIEDAHNKAGFRRMLERKFKTVQEIQGLGRHMRLL